MPFVLTVVPPFILAAMFPDLFFKVCELNTFAMHSLSRLHRAFTNVLQLEHPVGHLQMFSVRSSDLEADWCG